VFLGTIWEEAVGRREKFFFHKNLNPAAHRFFP
jgi:hypothetical protein